MKVSGQRSKPQTNTAREGVRCASTEGALVESQGTVELCVSLTQSNGSCHCFSKGKL